MHCYRVAFHMCNASRAVHDHAASLGGHMLQTLTWNGGMHLCMPLRGEEAKDMLVQSRLEQAGGVLACWHTCLPACMLGLLKALQKYTTQGARQGRHGEACTWGAQGAGRGRRRGRARHPGGLPRRGAAGAPGRLGRARRGAALQGAQRRLWCLVTALHISCPDALVSLQALVMRRLARGGVRLPSWHVVWSASRSHRLPTLLQSK